MGYDNLANFAYSTVATAPSPATSGTSLTLFAGDGAKFPAAPFNLVVWPTALSPVVANAEIVRVTAITGDVLTITRAQESSVARAIVIGDQIALCTTAKVISDLQTQIGGGVKFGSGGILTPIGNIIQAGPAVAFLEDGSIWVKFNTTADNLNWIPIKQ